jgi:hypothetical protein
MNSFFVISELELERELEMFSEYGVDSLEELIDINDSNSIDFLLTVDDILYSMARSSHYRQHQIYRRHCL